MTNQDIEFINSDLEVISLPTRSSGRSSSTEEQHEVNEKMSAPENKTVKIAAVQAEPAWNDLQGGVNKAIALIKEAGKNGANVLGFPEVFIPGYPW